MFEVGFVELLVIGVVALVVLGPERLPAAARTVGGFLRKARSSWQSVRDEFEREVEATGVKRSVDQFKAEAEGLKHGIEADPAAAAPIGRPDRPPHD